VTTKAPALLGLDYGNARQRKMFYQRYLTYFAGKHVHQVDDQLRRVAAEYLQEAGISDGPLE
jgi:hypothetical protein